MKKVLDLQLSLWGSCHFKTYPILFVSSFLFWTLFKQWGLVIQFQIKKFVHMGWANKKGQPKKEKKIMHISKVPTFPTYLFT
jgi:dipeptide/tripeptide permease